MKLYSLSFKMVESLLRYEDLTPEERAAVAQLKQRMMGHIEEEMLNDLCMFVRFLRARNLNINAAETMLRNHLEWRKLYQLDSIRTTYVPKELLKKYVSLNIIGQDKEGSPTIYFDLGNIDSRGLLKSSRQVDIFKYIVQILETGVEMMQKESLKRGKHICQWNVVLDFDNLSLGVATHKLTLEALGNLIVLYEGNYPERLKQALFLNASIYFSMAFLIVKPFISEKTYNKIKIFNKDGWKEELLELHDSSVLPAFLGGDRTDPDGNPLCKTFVTLGGRVPEKYYITERRNSLSTQNGVEKVVVSRMSKVRVPLDVKEAGWDIEWEFETKSRDIGFALFYKKNNTDINPTELIPKQRVDTYLGTETGIYKCKKPGIYVIEFDNSFSWIFQKEIYYKVSVIKNNNKT